MGLLQDPQIIQRKYRLTASKNDAELQQIPPEQIQQMTRMITDVLENLNQMITNLNRAVALMNLTLQQQAIDMRQMTEFLESQIQQRRTIMCRRNLILGVQNSSNSNQIRRLPSEDIQCKTEEIILQEPKQVTLNQPKESYSIFNRCYNFFYRKLYTFYEWTALTF